MADRDPAAAREVVLVGGGHAHVLALTELARRPDPRLDVTLVTDRLSTPYSGMLPGHVAGAYTRDEMHIDLARLAAATGARLVHAAATGIDRAARRVRVEGGTDVAFDILSLDVGITPDISSIEGAERHGVAVKPIGGFLARLDAALEGPAPARVALVGGGAAGVELACALRARLGPACAITLLSSSPPVPGLNAGVRRRVRAALARLAIAVDEQARVTAVDPDGVTLADGRRVAADLVIVSTAARAPAFLADSGLPTDPDGCLRIGPTLLVEGEDAIFAVGDCATRVDDPREKAGVFAVRQGPVLADNIRRRAGGLALREHRAQRAFLTLLSTGDGRAIAGKGDWFAAEGAWVWWWKDWIDRRFMARFQHPGRG